MGKLSPGFLVILALIMAVTLSGCYTAMVAGGVDILGFKYQDSASEENSYQ